MDLLGYLKSLPDDAARADFAQRCDSTINHVRNVSYGKTCAPWLAVAMERESGGTVSCEESRPDMTWHRVRDPLWPNRKGRPLLDLTAAAA